MVFVLYPNLLIRFTVIMRKGIRRWLIKSKKNFTLNFRFLNVITMTVVRWQFKNSVKLNNSMILRFSGRGINWIQLNNYVWRAFHVNMASYL